MFVEVFVGHEIRNEQRGAIAQLLVSDSGLRSAKAHRFLVCGVAGPDGSKSLSSRARDRRYAAAPSRIDHRADRAHNSDIAGTAAQVAAHADANRVLVRCTETQDEIARRYQHARCAIAALKCVFAAEGGAQFGGDLVVVEAFDRGDACAVAGRRKGDARARRHVVEQQRARAAHAVFAAEMRPRQVELVAQEIRQMGAGINRLVDRASVDGEADRRHAAASSIARRKIAIWICRSTAFAMPALIRRASAALATNSRLKLPVIFPPNSGDASRKTIGGASIAPITTRPVAASGSISTAAMAWANSPGLRQALT